MVLRPVRGHHAFEGCVEQLATAIRLGVYPLGSPFPTERELAERMGVSRATLREAIAALRQAGIVETRRGRGGGTVVTLRPRTPSARKAARVSAEVRADWLDSLEYRRVVEPGAAYLAALRQRDGSSDDASRDQLRIALDEVDSVGRPAEHRQADSRLHLAIAALTGSPRLVAAVTEVQRVLHEMLQAIPVLDANIEHSDRQHRRSYGRSSPASRNAHAERWRNTVMTPPRSCADCWVRRPVHNQSEAQLRNDRHLTVATLRAAIDSGEVDTVVVAFTDMQGRLQGKRLHGRYFVDIVLGHGTEGCNYLLGVDIDMNTVAGYAITSWDRGYGDMEFVLDLDTIRLLTHLPATAMVQCDLVWPDHTPVLQSPRSILKRQMDRAAALGFAAFAGTELEFIVFEDTYEAAHDAGYRDLTPANQYNVDYSILGTTRIEPLLRDIRNTMYAAGPERRGRQG